jgi:hypothetical protein
MRSGERNGVAWDTNLTRASLNVPRFAILTHVLKLQRFIIPVTPANYDQFLKLPIGADDPILDRYIPLALETQKQMLALPSLDDAFGTAENQTQWAIRYWNRRYSQFLEVIQNELIGVPQPFAHSVSYIKTDEELLFSLDSAIDPMAHFLTAGSMEKLLHGRRYFAFSQQENNMMLYLTTGSRTGDNYFNWNSIPENYPVMSHRSVLKQGATLINIWSYNALIDIDKYVYAKYLMMTDELWTPDTSNDILIGQNGTYNIDTTLNYQGIIYYIWTFQNGDWLGNWPGGVGLRNFYGNLGTIMSNNRSRFMTAYIAPSGIQRNLNARWWLITKNKNLGDGDKISEKFHDSRMGSMTLYKLSSIFPTESIFLSSGNL